MPVNRPIAIFANLDKGAILFSGSTVDPKFLGTVLASEHPSSGNRIQIVRTDRTKKDGVTPRPLFRRLRVERITNEAGVYLFDSVGTGGLGMTRAEIITYVNTQANLTATAQVSSAAFIEYDQYADVSYTGGDSDGTAMKPWIDIQSAVNAAADGDQIFLKGDFQTTSEVTLPGDKSLHFFGTDITQWCYASYSSTNGRLAHQSSATSTKKYSFDSIRFINAGSNGLEIRSALEVNITNCEFKNCGWSGNRLSTTAAGTGTWAAGGTLGYDSTQADLQSFAASTEVSDGGAINIRSTPVVNVTDSVFHTNRRAMRIQDCGIGGAGVVARNRTYSNLDVGIHLAAGSLSSTDGCENFSVYNNFSANNADSGVLVMGGIGNLIGVNRIEGNWNAGVMLWHATEARLRDCDLDNNNRSEFNGLGNTGDAQASIQIAGNTIRAGHTFLAEILDTTIHNTGLGASTTRNGLIIQSGTATSGTPLITVKGVGFVGQDYGIDLSEIDASNFRLALSDNTFQSVGELAVRPPTGGSYFELPFSNHLMDINYADFSVDNTGTVTVREGPTGSRINPYRVNELIAVAHGTHIDVRLKDSGKTQFVVPVAGCSIDGTLVNSVLNQALVQLNTLLTNSVGFASGGNPVTAFALSGTDLTITLQDGTSYTADVTTLGVDENNFVASGAINGSDLDLTMEDASVVTVDMSNMINGSTLSATNDRWYISYGTNADTEVGVTTMTAAVRDQGPYYFGQDLAQGSEFKFNINTGNQLRLGIWDGPEVATAYNASPAMTDATNWNTVFSYANGSGKFTDSSNTDVTTYHASGYTVASNAPMVIRFGADGHLTLLDVTGGTETVVAKTVLALAVTEFKMQFGGFANSHFPSAIISTEDWTIVHDFDSSEAGIVNGIEDHTVIRSNISIEIGEKIMFMLDEVGQHDYFGTGYSAASSGVATAEEQLDNQFQYGNNEAIVMTIGGASDWDANTNAAGYFFGASLDQYRVGGAGTIQGMFSLRFNNDGKLTIYDEDSGVKVATAKMDPTPGSSVFLYMGVRGNRAYYSIPVISKQSLAAPSQPVSDYAPVVADQTVTVTEADALNFQIVATDYIATTWVETDAPAWMAMNQSTGVLSGTAPAFAGTAADTIVVNCKAGNSVGGVVSFTVTVTVASYASSNTKSLQFDRATQWLQGNPVNMNAMERATNGDGAAWSVSMWVKPDSDTNPQNLMVYGAGDDYNGGAITLKRSGGNSLVVVYGTVYDNIVTVVGNGFVANTWGHILVTFDGGTTGNVPADSSLYFSRFKVWVNGVSQTTFGVATNNGYTGAISGANPSDNIYRLGRSSNVHNLYAGQILNQVGIWDSDQSANVATIYNSGATQDLGQLAAPPAHYYEFEASTTTIADLSGSAPLTGYNFSAADLVTDAP